LLDEQIDSVEVDTLKNTNTIELFDVKKIREDFPILSTLSRGKNLVYLDNAATTQKPLKVINALNTYYLETNANINRGVYQLCEKSTKEYERTRKKVKQFINAKKNCEVIFTKGTTDSINLVASSWGRQNLNESDEVLISYMEHHSNIVPWQLICEEKKAKLNVIPINDDGELDLSNIDDLLNEKVKILSLVHISNVLGTINPIKELIEKAHQKGILVLIDAAQSIQHYKIDVQDLDCDFLVFSAHKIYGPTGVGVLYGKEKLLDSMPPYQGGGDMIMNVSFEKTTYNELPYKFEAGTPNIAGVVGLYHALEYIESIGLEKIAIYEEHLMNYSKTLLEDIDGLELIGKSKNKSGLHSFVINVAHPHDVAAFLDSDGIAVRAGHHCAQPIMQRFNIPATTRASFVFYNTIEELDKLAFSIKNVIKTFK
jgi:cysteine desulfurase/selenocysteine lyase